jgi:SpoVK/Ycf46/Vps4 family AAA+-type ATPase
MHSDRDFITLPESASAAPIELACAHFALTAVAGMGARFSLRTHINDVLAVTAPHLTWPVPVVSRMQRFMAARCAEYEPWNGCGKLNEEEFMVRHGNWTGSVSNDTSIYYYLDEFVKHNAKDMQAVFDCSREALGERLKSASIKLLDNSALLAKVLGLTPAETWLMRAGALTKFKRDVKTVLVDCKVTHAHEAYAFLGQLAGVPAQEIAAALKPGARLESLGLIDSMIPEASITDLGDLVRMSDRLLAPLLQDYARESDLMAVFTKPAQPAKLGLSDYPHLGEDARYLRALLSAAAGKGEAGVNVLLYGPPGTGKTELAKLLAKEAACELYEVESMDAQGASLSGKDRYRALQISQAFLKGRRNTALLFDEVEDVFPSGAPRELLGMLGAAEPSNASVNGKAWVNQTLETNPVPTIWISNNIGQIDPAYLRRFQFHLELKNPPANVRETIVRKHLEGIDVSDTFVAKLAEKPTLTPAQIESAARFVRLTREAIDEPAEALIERQLKSSDAALGIKEAASGRPVVTHYDLSLLNIETQFPVERIITSLKQKQAGTLCFYGMPGTGKTALAEHIAAAIDRPLIIKRASDLVSKFVGETEQNMARMFDEARREKAVLLLDEADSFLQNRKMAERNYEVSEVNEMLQGMERFTSVFICTTNLMDRIDEAALRRFSFKIKFMALTIEQREKMFITEALGGDASRLTQRLRDRLKGLRLLSPGDFATVKRQWLLFDEPIDADKFLDQLEREHNVKPDIRYERPMGFTGAVK